MTDLMLDITVFEDLRNGDSGAKSIFDSIVVGEIKASVCPLTLYRLWSSPDFDRRIEIGYTVMISFLYDASLSPNVSTLAGIWLGSDNGYATPDAAYYAMIAAIAKARDETICTRNPEPFLQFYSGVVEY